MTKVLPVQYQEHLCKKLRQEEKVWGGRNKNTKAEVKKRGKIPKRKTRPLPCSKVAVHLLLPRCQVRHIIPRDTLANGFCWKTITMTPSPDAQVLLVALSKLTCDTSWSAHRTHVHNFPPFEPLISFAVHWLKNRQIMSHTCFLHSATVPTLLRSC